MSLDAAHTAALTAAKIPRRLCRHLQRSARAVPWARRNLDRRAVRRWPAGGSRARCCGPARTQDRVHDRTGLRGAATSAAGILYVATATDELLQVDAASGTILATAPARAGTTAVALALGETLLVAGDPGGVVAYDVATLAPVAQSTSDVGGTPIALVAR